MAEDMRTPNQGQQVGDVVKGDFATILVGLGTMLDGALTPLSKVVASALDSMTVVAKQILDGISNSTGGNKQQ
ncbi:hypothetical protein FGF66_09530 [Chlorobaculum thiosulfatiphilum]|jgi:hypothetical protein|uniref:Uncharacterized protein n=1 Tax=Chlorobaculum thiosulfatiphilum TaxID=115852 RepID=A0A5C4S5L6_CHLTI|nr:hypothetical protein [Chlorobaculum thiosulfatiphilum]TNJ38319.1 hypothetical protein FGF66_09530 [Chlorobaculum thiosulfatiphilum]